MVIKNQYEITVDLKRQIATASQTPVFLQNDSGVILIKITDSGKLYDYSSMDRYVISFRRYDGQVVNGLGSYDAETGMVKYELGSTEMETGEKGSVNLETAIQLYLGDKRISTRSFNIKILKDYEGGIGSEQDLTLLQELFLETEVVRTDTLAAKDEALNASVYARAIRDNFGHKGEYDNTKAYKDGNVVSYGGINYMCIKETTAGVNPLNGTYWAVVSPQATINEQTWTATEGQRTFTLTNGKYVVGKGNIEVVVGGVRQLKNQGYGESSETTITLTEGVPAGTIVYAKWFEGHMYIAKGHQSSHAKGGQDEIDVTQLKNFKETVTDKFTTVDGQLADIVINVKNPPAPFVACKVDGVTDDAANFNAIYNFAYLNGRNIYIPGIMLIKGTVGITTTLTADRSLPTISGNRAMSVTNNLPSKVQDGSMILYDAVGGSALSIKNLSKSKFHLGGFIQNIAIVKKGGDQSTDGSVGLDLQGNSDYRLFNVSVIGFDIGFRNNYGWSWDAYGLTCVRNRIGILLEDNSNAVGIHGAQLHQNNINVKITGGVNILFNKPTLEGANSIAMVITSTPGISAPQTIKIQNTYLEQNIRGFLIGKDENNITSDKVIYNVELDIINLETPNIVPIELDNVQDVNIGAIRWGHIKPLIQQTNLTKKVNFKGGDRYYTDLGGRYALSNRVGISNPVNLLPNGFLQSPDLTDFKKGGLVASFDTTTFPGEKVVKIEVPPNTPSNVNTRLTVKVSRNLVGKRLLFGGTAQADVGIDASFRAYLPGFSGITTSTTVANLPTAMGNTNFQFDCPDTEYIMLALRVVNPTAETKYVYIKSMVLVENGVTQVIPNPLDLLSGFSGSVAVTTSGTIVNLQGYQSDMYEVIVTPKSNITAYVTKANDQFTIYGSANGSVAYWIIPKCGITI